MMKKILRLPQKDLSPVTAADIEANDIIVKYLKKIFQVFISFLRKQKVSINLKKHSFWLIL